MWEYRTACLGRRQHMRTYVPRRLLMRVVVLVLSVSDMDTTRRLVGTTGKSRKSPLIRVCRASRAKSTEGCFQDLPTAQHA